MVAWWALQWVWNQPQASLCSAVQHHAAGKEENLVSAADRASTLTAEDLQVVEDVRQAYLSLTPIPCTKCEYCLPCPNDVAIPTIFAIYNEAIMYDNPRSARWAYNNEVKAENRADNCIECGLCEDACPQQIEIIDWLKKADVFLTAQNN